jgi:tetratricopeptide (TPR) repeat protein
MIKMSRLAAGALIAALGTPANVDSGAARAAVSTSTVPTGGAAPICVAPPGHQATLPQSIEQWAADAQLFGGLGTFSRPISTGSPQAQAYFDQGMRFLWAFNHDEATRSFAKAATLDPYCASCFWGVALTIGPNYNLPMMAEPRGRVAWDSLQRARQLAGSATPVEQALIAALAKRYPSADGLEPAALATPLTAYADAMKDVASRFPDDADVATMTAEAMMNLNAWKLWALDGTPAPGTLEIVARLEAVLARHPTHPGANHYYIHAIEASPDPDKAIPAAQRVATMMPAAGHLVHMPAHIWQRVGQFSDAAQANESGAAADAGYYSLTRPIDYYTMYTGHNYQFLAASRAMQGHQAETIAAARASRAIVSDEVLMAMPGTDWYVSFLYAGMVRFGMWDAILAEPAPEPKLVGLTAGYVYAKTVALAAKGRIGEAKASALELERIQGAAGPDDSAGLNSAKDVFAISLLVAKARIAVAEGRDAEAIGVYTHALAGEDQLAYDEPQDWFVPVRHMLGAALLKANRPAEAETVYREDLRRNRGNGWSLFGLSQALQAQGRAAEAAATLAEYQKAWTGADTVITASAF